MKIVVFYQNFTIPQGSWSTRIYEFARRWVRDGHEVTVVTGVFDKSGLKPRGFLSRLNVEGIDVRVVNIPLAQKHGKAMRLLTWTAYTAVANWYALTLPANVVMASSGPLTIGIPGLIARYIRRRPLVFEVRDLWPDGAIQLGYLRNPLAIRFSRALEKACYQGASRIVALSEGMADWIRREHGVTHLDVVTNACDNQLFGTHSPLELPEWTRDKKLVVYTGSLGKMDDCHQIVEMARHLEKRGADDIAIAILGDGNERAPLEAEVRAHGPRNVHFLGLKPKSEIVAWLRASRVALLSFKAVPCLDTVSPNKMFDAFAAGVPVVQATQGWIKNLLAREKCGITTPPGDAEAMAEAVLKLCRDETLRDEMAHNARRVALEQFDRDLLADKMRDILQAAALRQTREPFAEPAPLLGKSDVL